MTRRDDAAEMEVWDLEEVAAMNALRTAPDRHATASRDARISRWFLAWVVLAPLAGFALAGRIFDLGAEGDWEPWKAATIGVLTAVPFMIGAYFGIRAIRNGSREGWLGTVGNTALGALALGMPIVESITT